MLINIDKIKALQVGKTGAQLGYSEQWCADFVSDCADLAGQGLAISVLLFGVQ